MEKTDRTDRAVNRFAAQLKYEITKYRCQYKDWLVYHATSKTLKGTFYGYPIFVIIRADYCCRLATPDEVLDIMDILNS